MQADGLASFPFNHGGALPRHSACQRYNATAWVA